MLDKQHIPTDEEIVTYIGENATSCLNELEQALEVRYNLNKELRFPFGNQYGWGYKYSHRTKHLFYLFFESGAITVTLQIGDGQAVEDIIDTLSPYAKELWKNRYPCGKKNGGWVHYRMEEREQLGDILLFIQAKHSPRKSSH